MPEPTQYGNSWWYQAPEGTWLRWNQREGAWEPQAAPPPSEPLIGSYRPLSAPRAWAVWLLGLAILVDAIAVIFGVMEYSLLHRIGRGEFVTFAEADASDQRVATIAILQLVLLVGAAIAFITWFRLAYGNLRALGVSTLRFKPGWAIGGWFVPILNLWRPKQIANDLWRGSDPGAPPEQGTRWQEKPVRPLITWWWSLWIAAGVSGSAAARMEMGLQEAATIEDLQTVTVTHEFTDVLSVASGILAIAIVNAITRRQEARRATLGRGSDLATSANAPGLPGTAR